MNKVLQEILESGLEVVMAKVDGEVIYRIDGFFKSGSVTLKVINDEELLCVGRGNSEDTVRCYKDLVLIAY